MNPLKRLRSCFSVVADLEVTICFYIGAPMRCHYRGPIEFLMEMLNHVPTAGTMFGEKKIWKIDIKVNDRINQPTAIISSVWSNIVRRFRPLAGLSLDGSQVRK